MSSAFNSKKFVYVIGAVIVIAAVSMAYFLSPKSLAPSPVLSGSRSNGAGDQTKTTARGLKRPSRPATSGFVGSEACSECHAGVAELYRRHPMSRSMATVANVPAPHEDYSDRTNFNAGFSEYRVERKGDRVWHHEIVKDQDGVIFDQAEEIQFALGSGTRGRSYLLWREEGLFVSPIGWYTNRGWGLSPQSPTLRFSRRVNNECLQCHSGRYVEREEQVNLYPQPVFHEMSIGCERCHGPGKEHIEYRRSGKIESADPIVNPDRLASIERDAVCYQCHFTGEVRSTRYGHKDNDFRPGQKMSDNWLVFVKGTRTEGQITEAVSQAMQMESSQCYLKSGGRLGCISCHDAHSVPERGEIDDHYRQKCLKCHADRGCSLDKAQRLEASEKDSCIQCHMAPLVTKGVPHVSQSDHRIPRLPEPSERPSKEAPLEIYSEKGASVPPEEIVRARGLMLSHIAQLNSDREKALESVNYLKQWLQTAPDDEDALVALGWTHDLLGHRFEALNCWQRILQRNPRHEMALVGLASAAHNEKRYQEASGYFARLLDVHAWNSTERGQYANALGQLGQVDKALEQAKTALQIDQANFLLYQWLSQCYAHLGKNQSAQDYKALGRRIQKLQHP